MRQYEEKKRGHPGKGEKNTYLNFCRNCLWEYELPTPECNLPFSYYASTKKKNHNIVFSTRPTMPSCDVDIRVKIRRAYRKSRRVQTQ
jgi:hypothetical protein